MREQRILIADDDEAVRSLLYKVMRSDGLQADTTVGGEEALKRLGEREYDLLILDINMRGLDGFKVIEKIRARGLQLPIIVVSARKEDYDTVYGLNLGADDYVTKPFNPVILGAKVKALLRRTASTAPNQITAGPFTYYTSSLRLFRGDEEIPLTARENAMMKLFLDNPNRIFSKDMLYELVWGESIVDENAIMVYINRLRQKIEENPSEPKYIRTVRGIGYKFEVR